MLGETVKYKKNLSELQEISVENLPTGVYLFQFINRDFYKIFKISKINE
jgi:hypothetical protein